MGRRGRPAVSQEEKDRRRESKMAAKDQAIADTAMAKLPADKAVRDTYFREAEEQKTEAQSVAGQIGQHKKRGQEVYGITKQAMQIRGILSKCKQGVYEATVKQVGLFLKDLDRPFQLSMFDVEPGKGPQPDEEGSIFDKTGAGERHASERTDDPGKASKRRGKGAAPVPPVDTGALSPEQAEAAFKANADKAPKPASADNDDETDLRLRFLKDGDPTGEGPLPQRAPLEGADQGGSYKIVH